ncbi:MAG: PEP-CTERM sorting domain-containing protein [Chitinispirillaceae bacterium]|nr:PEP-CTERM sorting domain-containing protein [Chitinispirillaceae bacterium]
MTTEKQSVPEPSIISLLGLGLVSLPFFRRKKT